MSDSYTKQMFDAIEIEVKPLIAERDALFDENERLAAELAEAHTEIQELQRALSFWHPGVRADGTAAFVERAAHDAWLLAGYEGENEPGAAELGWIEATALETEGQPQKFLPCWCPYCGEPHSPAVRENE